MSRRKTFKILPRYTAKGRLVRMAQNAVKNKVKHAGLIHEDNKHLKKKSKESMI